MTKSYLTQTQRNTLAWHLDSKLRWKAYVKKKREEHRLKYKTMYRLTGRRSACRYTISWCCTNNIEACVDLQHTTVGMHKTKQHWHHSTVSKQGTLGTLICVGSIRNTSLHRDLQMEMVTNEIGKFAKKQDERLLHHFNIEAIQLLNNSELVQRLKRKSLLSWCGDH